MNPCHVLDFFHILNSTLAPEWRHQGSPGCCFRSGCKAPVLNRCNRAIWSSCHTDDARGWCVVTVPAGLAVQTYLEPSATHPPSSSGVMPLLSSVVVEPIGGMASFPPSLVKGGLHLCPNCTPCPLLLSHVPLAHMALRELEQRAHKLLGLLKSSREGGAGPGS